MRQVRRGRLLTDDRYGVLLALGRVHLDDAMADARRRNELTRACNGRVDCSSKHHLACCLTVKPRA